MSDEAQTLEQLRGRHALINRILNDLPDLASLLATSRINVDGGPSYAIMLPRAYVPQTSTSTIDSYVADLPIDAVKLHIAVTTTTTSTAGEDTAQSGWKSLLTHDPVIVKPRQDGQSILSIRWFDGSFSSSRVFLERDVASAGRSVVGGNHNVRLYFLESDFVSREVQQRVSRLSLDQHVSWCSNGAGGSGRPLTPESIVAKAKSTIAHMGDNDWGKSSSARPKSSDSTLVTPSAVFFRYRFFLSVLDPTLASRTLEQLDLESLLFSSSYSCVAGFEAFTAARVQQLVSDSAHSFFADLPAPMMTYDGGPGNSPSDLKELIEVACHVSALHLVSPVLLEHWRKIYIRRDLEWAKTRDHVALRKPMARDFGIEHSIAVGAIERATQQLNLLDLTGSSPYGLMCEAHIALEQLMESLGRLSASQNDTTTSADGLAKGVTGPPMSAGALTADDLLPLAAYALSKTSLLHLPSTIAFVRSFGLHHVELSALGYSFTTIEAAAQLLLT